MTSNTGAVCIVAAMLFGLFAGGCNFTVVCSLDEGFRDAQGEMPSVEVHIVGVNDTEFEQWSSMSMTEYWRKPPISPEIYKMKFGKGLPNPQTLKSTDPIWNRWAKKKYKSLFVLADLPVAIEDQPGDADPRRLILPSDPTKHQWNAWTIRLLIKKPPSGITCLNPPKVK